MSDADKEQTRALRLMRVEERRTTKNLNQVGKRISWCREKLELLQREVSEATGIPISSYCGREAGIRTDFWEEMLVLAVYFDREWQAKFTGGHPSFSGQEVKKITVSWLMFGSDEVAKDAELLIQEFKIRFAEIENDYWTREAEHKRQLDMFAGEGL